MSDSVLVLNKGKMVEYGKTAEVFAKPKSKVMKRLLNV
jgi:cationic peptide transport system ATP-binding protein